MRTTSVTIPEEYDYILKKYHISVTTALREGIILLATLNNNFPETDEEEDILIKSKISEIKRNIINRLIEKKDAGD